MARFCLVLGILLFASLAFASIPQKAYKYFPIIKEEHAFIWKDGDIGIIASQIQHESAWKENAMRKEPSGVVSYGLMQVLDVTYEELKSKNPLLLKGSPAEMLKAKIGIRAGILYDKQMWNLVDFACNEWERYAMMLSAYNGGYGWLIRDRIMAKTNGYNPNKWFGSVELFSTRSKKNFLINRRYVVNILSHADEYRKAINGI